MKNYTLAGLLVLVLLALTLTVVFAACPEYEDPALCVDGQWLVVNAAYADGVQVSLPEGVAYGDSAHCKGKPPAPLFLTNVVVEKGNGHQLKVAVQGERASESLTVSYGKDAQTRENNDKQTINFFFDLR